MSGISRLLFASSAVLLSLLALSAPYVDPGTPTFVISLLSLGMLTVTLVGSAAFIYLGWDPFEEVLDQIGS